ncbi:hypothetical protein EP331_13125 [bacterium]|nr:MAG: hypothetical protein EP331_13125 [bacterium]
MKSEKLETQLVEGSFSVASTKELICDLLDLKINLHEKKRFSNEIRFGKDHDNSSHRAQALLAEKKKFIEWIESLPANSTISINGIIKMDQQ